MTIGIGILNIYLYTIICWKVVYISHNLQFIYIQLLKEGIFASKNNIKFLANVGYMKLFFSC